jgi:hypothetical protein
MEEVVKIFWKFQGKDGDNERERPRGENGGEGNRKGDQKGTARKKKMV